MSLDVLCLRPESDFVRVDALPPAALEVTFRGPNDADVEALMREARALVIPAVGPKLASSLFDRAAVRFVQVTGAGVDRLDRDALTQRGIVVSNVSGGSNGALAEYALTTASLLLRRFAWADREIRAGRYGAFRARMLADNLAGLDGLAIGVIGLGVIGQAVAEGFHRAGCRIRYFDPTPRDEQAARAIGAESLGLDELLGSCDVVTVHVPLLPATRGLIGARELRLMKPSAVLIQASRGGIVDEQALADHLERGALGGVAVDVYSNEPPAPDHPLLALEGDAANRILFTPHIAGVTRQSAALLFRTAWDNVERVLLRNESPLYRVY